MPSMDQIMKMSEEELAAENARLVKRLVLTKVIIPVAIVTVLHIGVKILERKLNASTEN